MCGSYMSGRGHRNTVVSLVLKGPVNRLLALLSTALCAPQEETVSSPSWELFFVSVSSTL